ncbi:MAG: recombinase family protein, partial [Myxococcales bacterium]|nr:recombinase family protein [Myxococcales bacterium]
MKSAKGVHGGSGNRDSLGHYGGKEQSPRRAVGYVRVSTDMQAAEGMSLDAQRSAIESYCAMMGIKLVKLCQDVMSGGKDVRPGLADALRT